MSKEQPSNCVGYVFSQLLGIPEIYTSPRELLDRTEIVPIEQAQMIIHKSPNGTFEHVALLDPKRSNIVEQRGSTGGDITIDFLKKPLKEGTANSDEKVEYRRFIGSSQPSG